MNNPLAIGFAAAVGLALASRLTRGGEGTTWRARSGVVVGPKTRRYLDEVGRLAQAAGLPVLDVTSATRGDVRQAGAMARNMRARGARAYLDSVHPRVPRAWRDRMEAAFPDTDAMVGVLESARAAGVRFSRHGDDDAVDVSTVGLTDEQRDTLLSIMGRRARALYHDSHVHAEAYA